MLCGVQVFMQPYWCWLVTVLPLWLAPNLITFIGLLINISTTLPVILLDRNAEGLVSVWMRLRVIVVRLVHNAKLTSRRSQH